MHVYNYTTQYAPNKNDRCLLAYIIVSYSGLLSSYSRTSELYLTDKLGAGIVPYMEVVPSRKR